MVAYSFKRRFVGPIVAGLDLPGDVLATQPELGCYLLVIPSPEPKRQTIRADRKRHARPGEEVQLYCGMRTKSCFLIGRGKCVSLQPIAIDFGRERISVGAPVTPGCGTAALYKGTTRLDLFARMDGFPDFGEMRKFWREENDAQVYFDGQLICWLPKGHGREATTTPEQRSVQA